MSVHPPVAGRGAFRTPDGPSDAELSLCVHCGFCLSYCPTYLELGQEPDSPRGRLQLMKALAEERVQPTPRVLQHFDRCLQCRACETACPSLVPYGRLMEATRADLFQQGTMLSGRRRWLWRLVMRGVFPHPRRLRALGSVLWLVQRSGLQGLARRTGLLARIAPPLARLDALAPDLRRPFFRPADVRRYGTRGAPRATAAMLTGCVMPLSHPETHHATARTLARNGVRVTAPAGQVCCGALHAHGGDVETARALARRNIDAFSIDDSSGGDEAPDAIIVNAAGCGSHMKEYGHLLRDDPDYAARADDFAARVRDVSEYLLAIGFDAPAGALERSVTYQDSCHLVHAQRVKDAPRALLRSIPGLDLREMRTPDRCCGSAGLYSILQGKLSGAILRDKMADVAQTEADQVCSANPGCLLQLDAGLRLYVASDGAPMRSAHVIDLLDESYRAAEGDDYARADR
ncbi:MAG: 4Fe-4S dicluster domain-containing protein [Chloroflexi bacterium]|nr:4Fe-4S dicluster domain-containing protein [Chloroflexota bacterium]